MDILINAAHHPVSSMFFSINQLMLPKKLLPHQTPASNRKPPREYRPVQMSRHLRQHRQHVFAANQPTVKRAIPGIVINSTSAVQIIINACRLYRPPQVQPLPVPEASPVSKPSFYRRYLHFSFLLLCAKITAPLRRLRRYEYE